MRILKKNLLLSILNSYLVESELNPEIESGSTFKSSLGTPGLDQDGSKLGEGIRTPSGVSSGRTRALSNKIRTSP